MAQQCNFQKVWKIAYHSLFKLFSTLQVWTHFPRLILSQFFFQTTEKKLVSILLDDWRQWYPDSKETFETFVVRIKHLKSQAEIVKKYLKESGFFFHRNKWQECKCTHRFCQIKKQIMFLLKTLYESKFLRSVHKEAINHTPKFSH